MKIVLIGATGQLGSDLIRNNPGHDIIAPGRDVLDLERMEQVADVIRREKPEVIINCAAFHNVPLCEERPEQAFRINCVAVRDLARLANECGAWFVTLSSDYVFGGGGQREPRGWVEGGVRAALRGGGRRRKRGGGGGGGGGRGGRGDEKRENPKKRKGKKRRALGKFFFVE